MTSRVSLPADEQLANRTPTSSRNRRLSNFHQPHPGLTPSATTPQASNRRLSNFHTYNKGQTPRRSPLHPLNANIPSRTPVRQMKSSIRLSSPKSALFSVDRHSSRKRKPHLSKAELAQMYSSTIKLCQDNKINVRNTWTLNLIDYMSMLVKGDDDAENVSRTVCFQDNVPDENQTEKPNTNFQLAGATLEASVKIYCSRVDSVHTNAFKVLGGLSRTGADHSSDLDNNDNSEDEDEDPAKKRGRKAKRTGRATLETNLANITSQKLETDLAVDPLFQKMSAAFDEGGARGMLMNNLPVGGRGQLIFDSGELADSLISDNGPSATANDSQTDATYDVSVLLPEQPAMEADTICGSFLRYCRAKMGNTEGGLVKNASESMASTAVTNFPDSGSTCDTTVDDADPGYSFDYETGDLQNAGELGVLSTTPMLQDSAVLDDEDSPGVLENMYSHGRASLDSNVSVALVTQRGKIDLVEAGVALQEKSDYSFFDTTAMSGWAGASHWRFRATEASTLSDKNQAASRKQKSKRPRGKTAMLLDFSSQAPKIDFASDFAPGKSETANQYSASLRASFSEKKVTLPEDLHYSVQSLSSLFLKPKTLVKVQGMQGANIFRQDSDKNEEGWYNFDNDCDNENFCPQEVLPMGAGDDQDLGNDNMDSFEMNLIDEPMRVEKLDINYAKVAKKVDVRLLKSGIWSKLCGEDQSPLEDGTSTSNKDEEGMEGSQNKGKDEDDSKPDVRTGGISRLQEIVTDMPSFLPASTLRDVSLPYVFICLLHLANEKTLKISQAEGGSLKDLVISGGKDKIQ